jgi:uncharacterized protein
MIDMVRRGLWIVGTPLRVGLLAIIGVYRGTLSGAMGGRCRFYPSCSSYAEQAIRELGAVRGAALTVWRVLRCSPLTAGGVDHPPRRRRRVVPCLMYDGDIHEGSLRGSRARRETAA